MWYVRMKEGGTVQNFEEGGVSPTRTNPVGTFLREVGR